MTTRRSELSRLKNIGPTIERRLNEVGIYAKQQLVEVGAVKAYQMICRKYPNQTLPVCYYLYSLQGALTGDHWNDLPESVKENLRKEVGRGYDRHEIPL